MKGHLFKMWHRMAGFYSDLYFSEWPVLLKLHLLLFSSHICYYFCHTMKQGWLFALFPWLWVSKVYTKLLQKKWQYSSRTQWNTFKFVPSRAIAPASEEVSNLAHTMQSSQSKKHLTRTNKNNVCSPHLRTEMDKAALKLGTITAIRKYSGKLSLRINESTMKGLKSVHFRESMEET